MPKRFITPPRMVRRVRARYSPVKIRRALGPLVRRGIRSARMARYARYGLYGGLAVGGAALAYRLARRRIGHRKNYSNSKRLLALTNPTTTTGDTLIQDNLTALGVAASTDNDKRETLAVNIAGFKICLEFRNKSDTPQYVNVAVISPRDASAATIVTDDFFRADDNQRGNSFAATALCALQKHCMPINADKYNILWHYRFTLGGQFDSSPGQNPDYYSSGDKSYKKIEKFVKLRRQLQFDTKNDTRPAEGQCHLVIWHNRMFDAAPITGGTNMLITKYLTTFFRDSKY